MSQQAPSDRVPIAAPDVGPQAVERVLDVLATGQLAAGRQVTSFEREFAAFCGTDHAVATANGTAALVAALHGLGIGEGDTVLTTPFSFVATANAVRLQGATPVFADVDPETLNLDPDAVEAVLEEQDVDAILAVHLYGLPADMSALADLAERHDCLLIEDAAQAHGARYDRWPVGSFGDAACFSFYPTKNMTTGEGGMVLTDEEAVADRVRRFIDHGRVGPYEHSEVGHNLRLTDLAAAIGRAQLDRLPGFVEARRQHAEHLAEGLAGTRLELPPTPSDRRHAYHQFTVRLDDRDRLRAGLDDAGVDTGVYYPRPIHQQPAYAGFDAECPVAERAAERVLSLPVHPRLDEGALDRIVDATREVLGDA
jgi:dTDP-4-amino-4,6-dideoxygalactose transaminase